MKKFFFLLFAIILSGCSLFPQTLPEDPSAQLLTFTDPHLEQFFQANLEPPSFSVEIFKDSSEKVTYTLEFSPPDKTHTASNIDGQEFIYIGQDHYFKSQDDPTWYQLSIGKIDPAKTAGQPNLTSLRSHMLSSQELIEYLGEIDCGQLRCYQYQFNSPPTGNIQLDFDTTDYLLRHYLSHSSTQSLELNYAYQPITIEPPTDVTQYSIPDNPTTDDIKTIEKIYGSP